MKQDSDNTQTATQDIESCVLPTSPVCHEKLELSREDSDTLKDLLQGTENVVYESRDDTTGISFVRNGIREWVPIVVDNLSGGEMNAAEMDRCKRIVYFEKEESPYFSIRQGKFNYPTPIAKQTHSQLSSSRQLL